MQKLYPMMLDLARRRVLIVGGGGVAARKARGVLEAGAAHVAAVAPEICPEMPAEVERIARAFEAADLAGIELCFAATDSAEVNRQVVELCHARRILVNRADRDEDLAGDFTVPAIHRSGSVTVAVAASGSPRLAAAVRDEIATSLDPAWGLMGEVAVEIRRRLVQQEKISPDRKRQALTALSSREMLQAFRAGGKEALCNAMAESFPELRETQW